MYKFSDAHPNLSFPNVYNRNLCFIDEMDGRHIHSSMIRYNYTIIIFIIIGFPKYIFLYTWSDFITKLLIINL